MAELKDSKKRKKTGGKKIGSSNILAEGKTVEGDYVKVTLADMRKYTHDMFWDMTHMVERLPPDEQVRFYLAVAKMSLPALQSIDLTADVQQHVDVTEERLRKLAQLDD